jgi:RNA polymerase sigma-70 factor (ECF subfamily)
MSLDEREWMRRLRDGDPGAFDAVYRLHSARVLGFAARLCGTWEEAEDLTQDVFLAAYHTRSGFGARSRLLTWLLGIAVRRWRDRQRERARRPALTLDNGDELAPVGAGRAGGPLPGAHGGAGRAHSSVPLRPPPGALTGAYVPGSGGSAR